MLTVDLSAAPFVLHRWTGRPTLADVARLRESLEWEAAQDGPLYGFVDLRDGAVPETHVLRAIGGVFRDFEKRRKIVLLVVIVESWWVVSALNVIRWFSRHQGRELFVRTSADAVTLADKELLALGAPPLPKEVKHTLALSGAAEARP